VNSIGEDSPVYQAHGLPNTEAAMLPAGSEGRTVAARATKKSTGLNRPVSAGALSRAD
jgi:hypothetical protein